MQTLTQQQVEELYASGILPTCAECRRTICVGDKYVPAYEGNMYCELCSIAIQEGMKKYVGW